MYGGMGSGARLLALLLLVLVLAAGGLIWFDYLGLVDARSLLGPVRRLVGLQVVAAVEHPDDPLLLERERLAKDRDAVERIRADLDKRERELKTREDQSARDPGPARREGARPPGARKIIQREARSFRE